MNLKSKLFALILCIAVIPPLLLSLAWGWYTHDQVKELIYQQDRLLIQESVEPFEHYLQELRQEIQVLAGTPVIRSLDWQQRIRPFFSENLSHHADRYSKFFIGLRNARIQLPSATLAYAT